MKSESSFKEHKKMFIFILILSCIMTFAVVDAKNVFGVTTETSNQDSVAIGNYSANLGGTFAPLVSISGSPFIALTTLSFLGNLLNTGVVDSEGLPFAEQLKDLPISTWLVFALLISITCIKFLLSLLKSSKVFSDAVLGKIEHYGGVSISIIGMFLVMSTTTVYAAEAATSSFGDGNIMVYLLTNIIAFTTTALAYVVYIVMKTLVVAIDIFAFIFSPIPGSNAVFVIMKHFVVTIYTLIACANPFVASIIGLVFLFVALLFFRKARRLELYYRKIYLIPFYNAIFRRKLIIPLIPKKIPKSVFDEFDNIEICIESFIINKFDKFYKKEQCFFVRSDSKNYLFKKRLFGQKYKYEMPDEMYAEKCFRFLRMFSDESLHKKQRKILLVARREYNKEFSEFIRVSKFIDYNSLLEERKQDNLMAKEIYRQERRENSLIGKMKKLKKSKN